MKKMGFSRMKRLLFSIIAFALAFTMPCVSVAAATVDPVFYATANSDVRAVYGTEAGALQSHYDDYGEKEGRAPTLEEAIKKRDLRSLIEYFLAKNGAYYRANVLNPDFKFFNADNYLKANPDVAALVGNDKAAALEHYLSQGALQGRGSGTAFDAIIALVVMPQYANSTPDELLAAWISVEGKASTEDYTFHINLNEAGYLIYSATKRQAPVNVSTAVGPEIVYGNNSVAPAPIDKKTFTFLLYLCGTDLESGEAPGGGIHIDASKSLIKLLLGAYDEDNVNVLIYAGGTDLWRNDYLNKLLGGRAEGEVNKSAIFTVNKAGVKAAIEAYGAKLGKAFTAKDLCDILNNSDEFDKHLDMVDAIINANTLTMLEGTLGNNKMGDPNTLASFLNVAKTGEYKADHYGLSLWNHGGGSVEGVCFPDDGTGGLTIPEIKQAFDMAGFGNSASSKENKLGLLVFDACLMAGAETAAYLSDYYDMMYGSEEVTLGDIDYFGVLNEANEKAGNDYLSYYLAIEIVEDRLLNYTGDENRLATGALFEAGKAGQSLTELNNVAEILNRLAAVDANNAKYVYDAVKYARLKSEQVGSATTKSNAKDYVDMKNFLQMLKAELAASGLLAVSPELTKEIDIAIAAADEATYATAFNYAKNKVFYNLQDSDDVWYNQEFWNKVKGMELCGANIYVPYYQPLSSEFNPYVSTLGLQDYNTLITNFSGYINSDAEKERKANLAKELLAGYEVDNPDIAITGYAKMLGMTLEQAADKKYLSVEVKPYDSNSTMSQYSSRDAYIDLVETMDTMLVYITRRVEAMCAVEGAEDQNIYIDVVIGSKTVTYENLNGLQSAVNIFTDDVNNTSINVVKRMILTDPNHPLEYEVYDYIVPSDIEGYTEKDTLIKTIGVDADGKYISAKGTAKVGDTRYVAYHLFKLDAKGRYIYCGSADTLKGEGVTIGDKINDVESITFYHQTIDPVTNKLVYVEDKFQIELTDEDGVKKKYTVQYLTNGNGREYEVNDKDSIVAAGRTVNTVGETTDDRYYFAVSENETTILDDVFTADAVVNDDTHDTSDDFFNVLDKALGKGEASSAPTSDTNSKATENAAPAPEKETPVEDTAAPEATPTPEAAPAPEVATVPEVVPETDPETETEEAEGTTETGTETEGTEPTVEGETNTEPTPEVEP